MRVLDLVMPPACAGCGRSGQLFCGACRGRLRAPSATSDRFLIPDAGVVLGDQLTLAIAAYAYHGPMRRALAALKYTGASRLAPIVANLAASRLCALLEVTGPAALVPVPVHQARLGERGYNQAALVSGHLGRHVGLPTRECLARIRPTVKQHRLDRSARLRNLRGAFAPRGSLPRTVILVDDIITTNATLEACATVLRDAGTEAVYGFAVAREV